MDVNDLIDYKSKMYLALAKEKMEIFPGVMDFLDVVRKKFEKVALTTSSVKEFQEMIFKKYNLNKFFDVIVTGNEIAKGKPDPESYLLTLKKLSLPGADCIIIEDSDNGIKSAKVAGCRAIGITHSFKKEKLIAAGADIVVDNFQELQKLI